jgi:hypothetical protein
MTEEESYIKFAKLQNLKTGDKVRLMRDSNYFEHGYGWTSSWQNAMNDNVGKTGVVVSKNLSTIGVRVRFEGGSRDYFYPFFVLDVVERAAEEKDYLFTVRFSSNGECIFFTSKFFSKDDADCFARMISSKGVRSCFVQAFPRGEQKNIISFAEVMKKIKEND